MNDIEFESEYKPIAIYDSENTLKFNPPVYEQRYSAVLRCLKMKRWSGQLKKIVEFGCAEMRLLILLKSLEGVEHILQVDIDENLLVRNLFKAEPLICDYLREREKELVVDVYCGSIDSESECLVDTDVVIGVEIIEHLYPETIENVPYNIFGFMKPKIALFTTPNSECNVLFNMTDKFRHDDHKFEWTREQFEDWGHNICARFPAYHVAFYGIGPGPEGSEGLGCCSQMAVFVRKDFYELTSKYSKEYETEARMEDATRPLYYNSKADLPESSQLQSNLHSDVTNEKHQFPSDQNDTDDGVCLNENDTLADVIDDMTIELATSHIDYKKYRLIKSCVYPRNADERSREQKIYDEACYYLSRYYNLDDDHYDPETDTITIPVKNIFDLVYRCTTDINEFRYVMRKHDYIIDENDQFKLKPLDSEDDENYEEDHENPELAISRADYAEDNKEAEEEDDWD